MYVNKVRARNTFTTALLGPWVDDGVLIKGLSECIIVKEQKPRNDKYYFRHFTEHTVNNCKKDRHGSLI